MRFAASSLICFGAVRMPLGRLWFLKNLALLLWICRACVAARPDAKIGDRPNQRVEQAVEAVVNDLASRDGQHGLRDLRQVVLLELVVKPRRRGPQEASRATGQAQTWRSPCLCGCGFSARKRCLC